MLTLATGFTVIVVPVAVGYVVARIGFLGHAARDLLPKLSFGVLAPCLMFAVLYRADIKALFSSLLPVSAVAAATVAAISCLMSAVVWRRGLGRTVVGALAAVYCNANNIGVPIALYLLGDAAYAAPVVMLQLLVVTPIGLALLDTSANDRLSLVATLRSVATNPMILGSLAGVLASTSGLQVPPLVFDPIELIGRAAVPTILIAFGMSLVGSRPLEPGTDRSGVALALVLKLLVMPAVAYVVSRFALGLDGHSVFACTVLAALPSGQNVFLYAERYGIGATLARDTIFLSTLGSLPILIGLTAIMS